MEERGKVKYIDIKHVHLVKLLKYLGIIRNSKVDGIVLIKTETYLPKLEVIKLPWVPKHSKGLRKATIYDTPDLRDTFYLFVLIRRLEHCSDVYTISTKFNKGLVNKYSVPAQSYIRIRKGSQTMQNCWRLTMNSTRMFQYCSYWWSYHLFVPGELVAFTSLRVSFKNISTVFVKPFLFNSATTIYRCMYYELIRYSLSSNYVWFYFMS